MTGRSSSRTLGECPPHTRCPPHIGNFHRTIDGYLRGLPAEALLPALRELNLNPLERPIVDLGI